MMKNMCPELISPWGLLLGLVVWMATERGCVVWMATERGCGRVWMWAWVWAWVCRAVRVFYRNERCVVEGNSATNLLAFWPKV